MTNVLAEIGRVEVAGDKLQEVCHGASVAAGWWKHHPTGLNLLDVVNDPNGPLEHLLGDMLVGTKLALCHSELSEGLEGHRKSRMDDHLPQYPMLACELADCIIRAFDLAGALRYNLGEVIAAKLAYNAQRADHKPENRVKDGGKAY